jgi:uncharacterized coiled-coil DUF342 family protein
MEQNEKSELFKSFNEKKGKVIELRKELTVINEEKEKWFEAKTKLNQKISSLIKDLKQDKSARDTFTSEVKHKKEERLNVNTVITQKIEEAKKLNQEKNDTLKKYNIQRDPSQIKAEIDQLDRKIETEVMSFDKETQIMKAIKELRVKYEEAKKLSGVWEKMHTLSREIDDLKKQSDSVHRDIQTKAKESQTKHESLVSASEEVKKLTIEENAAFEKFIDAKKKFTELNNQLKKEQTELNTLKEKLNEIGEVDASTRRNDIRNKLKEMEQTVEQKFKTGKKLTTEDLLVFQQSESKR